MIFEKGEHPMFCEGLPDGKCALSGRALRLPYMMWRLLDGDTIFVSGESCTPASLESLTDQAAKRSGDVFSRLDASDVPGFVADLKRLAIRSTKPRRRR